MKLQRFTDYLLANRLRTILILVAVSLIPVAHVLLGLLYVICITLGVLFAGFVTLRKGAQEGALMTATVTLLAVLKFAPLLQSQQAALPPLVFWTTVIFWALWAISNVLTWIFAILLSRQMNWSAILQVAALGGVMVVSVVHLAYPDIADWWGMQLTKAFNQAVTALPPGMESTGIPSDMQKEAIDTAKSHITGMIIAMLLLNAMVTLVVARWWQAVLYAPGMLRRELHHIRLSNLAGVLFLLSQLLVVQGNSVMLDSIPVLYLLFACAGLSVIHYFLGLMVSSTRWFWLALLYVVVYYTMPLSLMLLSMVALMDIWFDLRKRLRKI